MNYQETFETWKKQADPETAAELSALTDPAEIQDRFYRELEFGTGGLRGVMAAGTNRMNRYVIGKATQGLAEYIREQGDSARRRGVVIAHDSRQQLPQLRTARRGCFAGERHQHLPL